MTGFSGSYAAEDVTFLMKPVDLAPDSPEAPGTSGDMAEGTLLSVEEKERLIQSGARHYSEMLSPEQVPSADYLRLYDEALARNGRRLARDILSLATALAGRARGREVVIASLARAGTPIGVLLHRALARLCLDAPHYSLSIIRDRGIDLEALRHIAALHDPADTIFLDGWTGKGAIAGELRRSLAGRPFGFAPFLAVVADPAGAADLAASDEDYLIPSGLLNSIVSGLVSRSILNDALVGPGDFHACASFAHLTPHDRSRAFIDAIDALMREEQAGPVAGDRAHRAQACVAMVADLMHRFGLNDRNRIKPGIAEATRALLRRLPERVLVRDPDDPDVAHLVLLARERGVPVEPLDRSSGFRAVTIIRRLGRD